MKNNFRCPYCIYTIGKLSEKEKEEIDLLGNIKKTCRIRSCGYVFYVVREPKSFYYVFGFKS